MKSKATNHKHNFLPLGDSLVCEICGDKPTKTKKWEKEFDREFEGMVTIWPSAFVKDADTWGFGTTIDLRGNTDLGIGKGMLKAFIRQVLQQAVEENLEEVEIDMGDCDSFDDEEPTTRIFARAGFKLAVDKQKAKIASLKKKAGLE